MNEPWSADAAGASVDPDTIALLQEEIARLEDELRMRDEAAEAERHALRSEPRATARDEAGDRQIARLGDEIAGRDETIALLLEQVRLSEEAEASSRAEWDQLNLWVQEVERRVAERTAPETDLRDQLEVLRSTAEAQRLAAEKEQRSWDAQRLALVAEVERLRAKFSQVAGESDTTVAAVQALEHENRQLRDAYDELARNVVPAYELDAIVTELQAVRKERDTLAREPQQLRDDLLRERIEHEAALNAARSQLARESLRRQEEQVRASTSVQALADPLLDPDQRIRAFREHLKEIHQDETEQRMKRGLTARLSRLWNHTGPNS
jgi:uncharacterized small protein (DUF1192 family)